MPNFLWDFCPISQAALEKLMRARQSKALDQLVPWKDKDHPELKQGTAKWVRKIRRENERRYRKMTARKDFPMKDLSLYPLPA
jgi:hypothetical protein